MPMNDMPQPQTVLNLNQETIACLARQLWEQAGCPSGRDLEFWLAAERQLAQDTRPTDPPSASGGTDAPPARPVARAKKTRAPSAAAVPRPASRAKSKGR